MHSFLNAQLERMAYLKWVALTALSLVFLASQAIGGETWDEYLNRDGYVAVTEFGGDVLSGKASDFEEVPGNLEFYGILQNMPAAVVTDTLSELYGVQGLQRDDIYRFVLHLTAFLCGIGSLLVVGRILLLLTGDRTISALGVIALALYPTWLGHMFFNYKDLPQAFCYTLGLYGCLVANSADRAMFRKGLIILTVASIASAGIKLAGLPLMVAQWAALAYAITVGGDMRRRLVEASVAGVIVLLGVYIITPAGWAEPVRFVVESVAYMSKFDWDNSVLTNGQLLSPAAEDWSIVKYLSNWMSVTLPLFMLVLAIPSAIFLLLVGGAGQRIVVAAAIVPLCALIALNSTIYDALRHLLFLVPPTILMIILAIARLRSINRIGFRIALSAVALNVLAMFIDNVSLFPYNYVYFNEPSRNLARADTYDLDYWGFSLRQAVNRLNRFSMDHGHEVQFEGYPAHLTRPFATSNVRQRSLEDIPPGVFAYWVAYTRANVQPPPGCVFEVAIERKMLFQKEPMRLSMVANCKK